MRRLLLDTHTFIWWVQDADELTRPARRAIANPETECLLSLASCWEMVIKLGQGKLKLPGTVERFVADHLALNRFRLLPIELRHVSRVANLELHHRDLFDRLLAAQGLEEDIAIVSADPIFPKYGLTCVW